MIYGIGTDIVAIGRITELLLAHTQRFPRRILTDHELVEYEAASFKSHFLAKRFAAKEAVVKAFGTGFGNGLSFKDIEVQHKESGSPFVKLSGRAEELAREHHLQVHLSITDERDYACAFSVLEVISNA